MSDGEHDHAHCWLADDLSVLNGVLIVAASSVALVLASWCVWRAKHTLVHANAASTSKDHREHNSASSSSITQSMLTAALSSLHIVSAASAEFDASAVDQIVASAHPSLDAGQQVPKGSRSKERRRRGKDPYKELLKGGKKSKALLKAIKVDNHDQEHSRSVSPLVEEDSRSSTSGNDVPPSALYSKSSGPLTTQPFDDEQTTPPAGTDHPAASMKCDLEKATTASVAYDTPSDYFSSSSLSSHRPSRSNSSHSRSPSRSAPSTAKATVPASMTDLSIVSPTTSTQSTVICPPDASDPSDASALPLQFVQPIASMPNLASGTSCDRNWEHESYPESSRAQHMNPMNPPTPGANTARITTSASAPSHLPSNDGNAAPSSISLTGPSPKSSPHSSPIVSPFTFPSLNPLPLDMRDGTINGAGPSTPIISRGNTPSSQLSGQVSSQGSSQTGTQVSAQTQLASMRGALEAARLREEKSRAEVERVTKECEDLRWRWNEDAGMWRRRETELQAQIHHLMQQLHTYAAILATFPTQHAASRPSTSFSSPTSPSPHTRPHSSPRLQQPPSAPFPLSVSSQFQNPTSAPVHVQAMLASAPMLTPHHQGFAGGLNGMNPPMGVAGMSPLLWSGLGFAGPSRNGNGSVVGQRTPDSSASGSPSRGRRRERQAEDMMSASDDSSLGDWDGTEESSGGDAEDVDQKWDDQVDEEDDIFHNNALADAILKRPESLRELGGSGRKMGSSRIPSRTSIISDGSTGVFFHTLKGKESEGRSTSEKEEIAVTASGSCTKVVEHPDVDQANVTITMVHTGDEDAAVNTPLGDPLPSNSNGHQ